MSLFSGENIVSPTISGATLTSETLTAPTITGAATLSTGGTFAVADADALKINSIKVDPHEFACVFLPATEPATAANYPCVFFIAPRAMKVTQISERHGTAGNNGSAVSLTVEKLTSGTAAGSGVDQLGATKIDLKATADTPQTPALSSTAADITLAAGDALALKLTGTPTAVANLGLTVTLIPV